MGYFLVEPDEVAALTAAYAATMGAPHTAASLLGQAARDDALGLPESATVLRTLARLRQSPGARKGPATFR